MPQPTASRPNFAKYLSLDTPALRERYFVVMSSVAEQIMETAITDQAYQRARTDGYVRSLENGASKTAAEKDAVLSSINQLCDLTEAKAELAVLNEEKYAIERALEMRV